MVGKLASADVLLKSLKNPFDPKFVKVRVGATSKDKKKGIALFYLDSREVQKRLDEVLGVENYQTEMTPITAGDKLIGTVCKLSIKMPNGEWVSRTDGGEPSNSSPFKGSCSDALKRAAVQFGVGRYLYYIPNQWYPLNEYRQFVSEPQLPNWAMPQEVEDWEEVAIAEYNPANDVNLDTIGEYTDEEAKTILQNAQAHRQAILDAVRRRES